MKRTSGLAAAVLVLLGSGSAFAQYTYSGPAFAVDSGLSCVGVTKADEDRLDRVASWGANNNLTANGTYIEVLCPLRRRNTEAYAQQANSDDRVLINNVDISVKSSASWGVVRCSVFAYSAELNQVFESPFKYACSTPGGCTSPPANADYGFTNLSFAFPLGSTAMSSQGTVNVGYHCFIPNNWSRVIGAQAEFAANN